QLFKQSPISGHAEIIVNDQTAAAASRDRGDIDHQWEPLHITEGQLKIERLRSSVELIIEKHSISRTSIKYDLQDNSLKQHINNEANRYSFQITHLTVKNPNEKQQQLDDILMDEQMNSNLEGEGVSQEAYRDRDFDLAQGSHQTAYLYIDSILMIRRSQIRHLYPIDL
ncbi:unnamed protein product, partial [Didymodactylos carnosus]